MIVVLDIPKRQGPKRGPVQRVSGIAQAEGKIDLSGAVSGNGQCEPLEMVSGPKGFNGNISYRERK